MDNNIENLYQLKKRLIERKHNFISSKIAGTFIKNVTCAFTENDYFKEKNNERYHYTKDFVNLVIKLSDLLDLDPKIHTYLLQCKKCSISFIDMEHFFYLLVLHKDNLSETFIARLQKTLLILHFIRYNRKTLKFNTNPNTIKKKLLFYLVCEINDESFRISPDLTISQFINKITENELHEI